MTFLCRWLTKHLHIEKGREFYALLLPATHQEVWITRVASVMPLTHSTESKFSGTDIQLVLKSHHTKEYFRYREFSAFFGKS